MFDDNDENRTGEENEELTEPEEISEETEEYEVSGEQEEEYEDGEEPEEEYAEEEYEEYEEYEEEEYEEEEDELLAGQPDGVKGRKTEQQIQPEDESSAGKSAEDEDLLAGQPDFITGRSSGRHHSRVSTAAPITFRAAETNTGELNAEELAFEGNYSEDAVAAAVDYGKREKNPKKKRRVVLGVVIGVLCAALLFGAWLIASSAKPFENLFGDKNSKVAESSDVKQPDDEVTEPDSSQNEEGDIQSENANTETIPEEEKTENIEKPISEPEPEPASGNNEEPDPFVSEVTDTKTDDVPAVTEPEVEPTYHVHVSFYGREDLDVTTVATTFAKLLSDNGITLDPTETPSVTPDTEINSDMNITVEKTETVELAVNETLGYETKYIDVDTIPRGETVLVQEGSGGAREVIYIVVYKNGEEISREVKSEKIIGEVKDEIYNRGVGGTLTGIDGKTYTYSYRKTVPAICYHIEGPTYIDTYADETTIAANFDFYPLGTKLYVKNDRYDLGARKVADIGGQLEDWEIDVWLSYSNPYYNAFSKEELIHDMDIYYLD